VVAFDLVVPVLGRVVEHVAQEFVHNARQRCGQFSGDLAGPFTVRQHRLEEPGCSGDVASLRHPGVDDLAVLVDCSAHLLPDAG
jgi:hypothetical protein